MGNSKTKNGKSSAVRRVLIIVSLLFFSGWLITLTVLLTIKADKKEIIGSIILFGGFILCWALTVFILRRKNPKYVQSLFEEITDQEAKERDKLIKGS